MKSCSSCTSLSLQCPCSSLKQILLNVPWIFIVWYILGVSNNLWSPPAPKFIQHPPSSTLSIPGLARKELHGEAHGSHLPSCCPCCLHDLKPSLPSGIWRLDRNFPVWGCASWNLLKDNKRAKPYLLLSALANQLVFSNLQPSIQYTSIEMWNWWIIAALLFLSLRFAHWPLKVLPFGTYKERGRLCSRRPPCDQHQEGHQGSPGRGRLHRSWQECCSSSGEIYGNQTWLAGKSLAREH